MNAADAAKRIYHVARLDDEGDATFAFNLRRRDGGGIGLSNIKTPLSDTERTALFSHFGVKLKVRTGGTSGDLTWEGVVDREPGTDAHFLAAAHSLPDPFCLVSSED